MNSPLYEYGLFGEGVSLIVALVIGFFFGLFLERGGLGNPHKLIGVFYLKDFAVPKTMFTAILVASSGLYLLGDLKLLDMTRIWIVPAFFWPQLIGGALFGLGYLVAGYCPGTAVAGLASGRLDALVAMFGMIAGSLLFAAVYPALEHFYMSSALGTATLPSVLGVNHWVVIAFVVLMAGMMFYSMERFERKTH
ncbi:MAG: YeeE/YedE thiosulfate transporter family protein [Nitrospiraceae bacterium]|nr:YeeE/YedE thiosulfate transporter family protein [Nitrospiraceae bacterium]